MTATKNVVEASNADGFLVPGRVSDDYNLPDANAPFIRNAWYVVAKSVEVGRELRGIRALGEPLVLYRTEEGEPIVLDDRCAHKRFPLSKSKLVGNRIQCGYHGFTYEQSGRCVWAPTNAEPNFGVRRYPCVEVGPWLWAWMGDPEKADPEAVPYPKLDPNENWCKIDGYKLNPGNYLLLIENLLDLTHLHFLHGDEVVDLAQANTAPKSLDRIENGVGYTKETTVAESKLFATLTGGDPNKKVRTIVVDIQYGPSLNHGSRVLYALEGDEDPLYPIRFQIIHAITPEEVRTTHQFFQALFNRELLNGLESFRDLAENVVLQQDCDALAYIQAAIDTDRRIGNVEFGIAGDRFGITMRKVLRKMKQDEART